MRSSGSVSRVVLPRGLYGADQVDVAYEPWRALRRTALRLGTDVQAPVVRADDGTGVVLEAGQHFGRQSTRNPGCVERPPLRPAVAGFVWGYCMPPATRKSGWMALADLEADLDLERRACGPAGADFDRRDPRSCGGHCDGRPLSAFARTSGDAVIVANDV